MRLSKQHRCPTGAFPFNLKKHLSHEFSRISTNIQNVTEQKIHQIDWINLLLVEKHSSLFVSFVVAAIAVFRFNQLGRERAIPRLL